MIHHALSRDVNTRSGLLNRYPPTPQVDSSIACAFTVTYHNLSFIHVKQTNTFSSPIFSPSLDRPAVLIWVERRYGYVDVVLVLSLDGTAVGRAAAIGVRVARPHAGAVSPTIAVSPSTVVVTASAIIVVAPTTYSSICVTLHQKKWDGENDMFIRKYALHMY